MSVNSTERRRDIAEWQAGVRVSRQLLKVPVWYRSCSWNIVLGWIHLRRLGGAAYVTPPHVSLCHRQVRRWHESKGVVAYFEKTSVHFECLAGAQGWQAIIRSPLAPIAHLSRISSELTGRTTARLQDHDGSKDRGVDFRRSNSWRSKFVSWWPQIPPYLWQGHGLHYYPYTNLCRR